MPRTADKVAAAAGVSRETVKRAGEYAENVDRIASTAGPKARNAILSGAVKMTREQVPTRTRGSWRRLFTEIDVLRAREAAGAADRGDGSVR